MTGKGREGDAVEAMAGSQLLEKCEGLSSSSEGSADTRERTFVGEASSNSTWQPWQSR